MKPKLVIIWFFCSILLSSCIDGNYSNVRVSGEVVDIKTGIPIINAKVTVVCWAYDLEQWESKTEYKSLRTDSLGKFKVTFKRGEAIDISIDAIGFKPQYQSKTLKRNAVEFKCLLEEV